MEQRVEKSPAHLKPRSKHIKQHVMNIYITNSDEETIVSFVKDPEKLYDKTNEHNTRKDYLLERFEKQQQPLSEIVQNLV